MSYDDSYYVYEFLQEFELTINDLERYSSQVVDVRTKRRHLIMAIEEFFPNLKNTERASKVDIKYSELRLILSDEIAVRKENKEQKVTVVYVINQEFKNFVNTKTCIKCGSSGQEKLECKRTNGAKKCYKCRKFVTDRRGRNCLMKATTDFWTLSINFMKFVTSIKFYIKRKKIREKTKKRSRQ